MKDEEWLFVSDVVDKKNVARSARSRRTHNGKSGRVKFPSDYMTKKEKEAMSGEVKSYRLNDPMTWKEFKAMPDDIKITYIKLLREKFNCFDTAIAEMMGIGKVTLSQEIKRLGLGHGTKHGGKRTWNERESFYAWVHGVPVPHEEAQEEVQEEENPIPEVMTKEQYELCHKEKPKAIPNCGNMVFEGNVEAVVNALSAILGGANVHISITWDVLDE